jgi:hypothetical protein
LPTPTLLEEKLSLNFDSRLTSQQDRRTYHARFVRAGRVRQADGGQSSIDVLPEALSRAVEKGLFDKKAVFIDHAAFFDNPSLRDLVGDTRNSVFTGDAVEGIIEFYNTPDGQVITNLLDELLTQGQAAPDVGLSIVFYPVWQHDSRTDLRQIVDIKHVESVDLVFGPAADGRLLQALSVYKSQSHGCTQPQFTPKEDPMPEEYGSVTNQTQLTEVPAPVAPTPTGCTDSTLPPQPQSNIQDPTSQWLSAMADSTKRVMISTSGLPHASQARLLAQSFDMPAAVEAAIESEAGTGVFGRTDSRISLGVG